MGWLKEANVSNEHASDGSEDIHGNTLGVDGSQVGVFEEGNEVGLGSLLESHDGGGLETEIGLRDGTNDDDGGQLRHS